VSDRDRWVRLETVFAEALASAGDARRSYLDRACADDAELRAEVESLLQAHQEDSGFLEFASDGVSPADAAGAATPLAPGTRLGPFEIVAWMGAGGMGDVYHARDTRLDRSVAVKVLTRPMGFGDDALRRLEHEARAISRLVHPHVCTLHDIGSARLGETEIRFLVMELVSGETLAAVVSRGPLAIDVALQYAIQTADALASAHSVGIVHRDLKPQNVMITAAGVKLLDFGLALVTNATRGMAPEAGPPPIGSIVGTAHYMAPEQIRGEDVDRRADVFSFGLVLHEMLTATRAFRRPTIAETLNAILHDPAPRLPEHVPANLGAIVGRCLEKDRALRFQSADALAGALRAAESARHDDRASSWLARHRLASAAIASTGVLLATLAAVWVRADDPQPRITRFVKLTSDEQQKSGGLVADRSFLYIAELVNNKPVLVKTSIAGGATAPLPVPFANPWLDDIAPNGSHVFVGNYEGASPFAYWLVPTGAGTPPPRCARPRRAPLARRETDRIPQQLRSLREWCRRQRSAQARDVGGSRHVGHSVGAGRKAAALHSARTRPAVDLGNPRRWHRAAPAAARVEHAIGGVLRPVDARRFLLRLRIEATRRHEPLGARRQGPWLVASRVPETRAADGRRSPVPFALAQRGWRDDIRHRRSDPRRDHAA
jgi:serine/threonine protein kinase